MILQSDHLHSTQQLLAEKPKSFSELVWEAMLKASSEMLNPGTVQEIGSKVKYFNDKVYLSYCNPANDYLQHISQKSISENRNKAMEVLLIRESKVNDEILEAKLDVEVNHEKQKMKKIKEELKGKVASVKQEMKNFSLSSLSEDKKKELQDQHMEFRKKGYWKQKSVKNQEVKEFIRKLNEERKQLEVKNQQKRQKQQRKRKEREQRERQLKEVEENKIKQELHEKRVRVQSQRQKHYEINKKLQQQSKVLVRKYKKKPIYLLNEERFIKEVLEPAQAERKRKLAEMRKDKKPIDVESLELHQQWYEELKEKALDVDEKRQQFREILEKNQDKLKQLYHGHFHEKFQQEENPHLVQKQEKKKIRNKITSYSENVKESHRPIASPKKRNQLQKMMNQLEQKANRGKKKVLKKDGTFAYEEVSFQKQRNIGKSYLEQLRTFNEGKKRKNPEERSESMMQLTKKPVYHDYLKQIRSNSRIDTAKNRTNWKKVLKNDKYTDRDKYHSVIEQVQVLQNKAKQKQLQLKYTQNESKAVDIKKSLDNCYIESLNAKMNVLKDVILKQ